jgi:hypothetical protein
LHFGPLYIPVAFVRSELNKLRRLMVRLVRG